MLSIFFLSDTVSLPNQVYLNIWEFSFSLKPALPYCHVAARWLPLPSMLTWNLTQKGMALALNLATAGIYRDYTLYALLFFFRSVRELSLNHFWCSFQNSFTDRLKKSKENPDFHGSSNIHWGIKTQIWRRQFDNRLFSTITTAKSTAVGLAFPGPITSPAMDGVLNAYTVPDMDTFLCSRTQIRPESYWLALSHLCHYHTGDSSLWIMTKMQ